LSFCTSLVWFSLLRGTIACRSRAQKSVAVLCVCVLSALLRIVPALAQDAPESSAPQPQAGGSGGLSDLTDRKGDLSLGVSFGLQGAPAGKEAIGFRYGAGKDLFLGLSVQHGFDGQTDAEVFAAYLECGFDLARSRRAKLAATATVAGGEYSPSDKESSGSVDLRADPVFFSGFAMGAQVEVWLLPEISLALKAEWGGQVTPSELQKFSTASSELQVFLHLDGGQG
jgi:hypothetical protein